MKLIVFLIVILSWSLSAEINPFKVLQVKEEDGLGDLVVYEITQDKTGFIWLGTNAGIVRYDGNDFVYFNSHATEGGTVRSVIADKDSGIWAASDLGLSYKPAQQENFNSIAIRSVSTNKLLEIKSVLVINKKHALIGTNEGLFRVSKNLQRVSFLGLNNCTVITIKNTLLGISVGTNCGLYLFKNGEITPVPLLKSSTPKAIVRNIQSIPEGILIGTYGAGIFYLNNLGQVIRQITSAENLNEDRIYGLALDSKNRVWVGFDSMGVQVFDIDFNELAKFNQDTSGLSISDDAIENIFVASNGDIFIGTTYGGLNIYRTNNEAIKTIGTKKGADYTLTGNTIRTLNSDLDNQVWFGIHGNQFSILDLNKHTIQNIRNDKIGRHPKYFLFEKEFDWVFDEIGISKLDKAQKIVETYTPENSELRGGAIDSAVRLNSEEFAIGHWGHGISIFNVKTRSAKYINSINSTLPSDDTLGLLLINKNLWIITKAGLSKYDIENESVSNFPIEHLGGYAYPNHLTKNGNHLVIATSRGLTAFSLVSEKFDDSIIPSPLKAIKNTRSILNTDSGYWVTTDKGLINFNNGNLRTLNRSHGLIDIDFIEASAKGLNNGRIAVGGVNGASIVDTTKLIFPEIKPTITEATTISSQGAVSKSYTIGSAIALTETSNLIQLKVSDLTFRETNADYIFKKDEQSFTYSNGAISIPLEYGNNKISLFNGKKLIKDFHIENPIPIFATWYAWLFYAVVISYIGFSIIRWRTKKLIKQSELLEKTVTIRTNELKEKSIQALEQAKQIKTFSDERQALFENVSHELRTPLTLILGITEQLNRSKGLSVSDSHKVEIIKRNGERLNRLTNQVLELSRVSYKNNRSAFCNLSSVVSNLINTFSCYLEDKSLTLTHEIESDCFVTITKSNAELLVGNILSNAVKYNSTEGTIHIRLNTVSNQVFLSIKDTGIGIAKVQQAKVFERFYRVNAVTSKDIEGSGMGLSIVKQIIDECGGQISLRSTPGVGTKFELLLPIKNINTLTDENSPTFIEESTDNFESPSSVEKENVVLLIDDNDDILAFLSSIFGSEYEVITAVNGIDGLKKAHKYIPDLIISDVMMPDLDGLTLLEKLKSNDLTNNIPCILLTAKGSAESRITGLKNGADDYIAKPFNEIELTLKVKNLLNARELIREKLTKQLSGENQSIIAHPSFLERLDKILAIHYSNPELTVSQLSKLIAIGERQLLRKLKSETNLGPKEYIKAYRLRRAADLLTKDKSPSVVASMVGFNSPSHFSKSFKEQFGCPPSEYN